MIVRRVLARSMRLHRIWALPAALSLFACASQPAASGGAAARPNAAAPAAMSPPMSPASAAAAAPKPASAPAPALFEDGLAFDGEWRKGDAAALGLDVAMLGAIVEEAARTRSDALLVMKDGQVVVERTFGKPRGPIETMSATKSVVSIAIGMLVADGKIASVDAPLSSFYPDWKTGRKAKVTLRHVLTHTSGLEHRQGARVLTQQADRSKFVRAAEVTEEPGARFSYSNEAVQLLAGVVKSAAGEPLDAYLAKRLFTPLGITEWRWDKDKAGNVQTFYGLALGARDLARIGRLMLQNGAWNGKQLVPAEWVEQSTTMAVPGSGHGFLWWVRFEDGTSTVAAERLADLVGRGFGAAQRLEPLVGHPLPARPAAVWMEIGARLDAAQRRQLDALLAAGAPSPAVDRPGSVMGYAADGWLGQQLIVLPSRGMVAVRQMREPTAEQANEEYNRKYGFFDLVKRLGRAAKSPP
jgi:CubicO group peptidase (beta-lactamase class C family)